MFNVSGDNIIHLTKGNSAVLNINLYDESGEPRPLVDGDVVLFTLKKDYGSVIFQKKITNKDYSEDEDRVLNCILKPSDTSDLPIGEYKYDCLLVTFDGQADTFISSSLILTDAYGFYTDTGGDDI